MLLSPDYTPDIGPTFRKLLEAVLPSFLRVIFNMLLDLLALARLKMLSK
jgi:hypothetical protein